MLVFASVIISCSLIFCLMTMIGRSDLIKFIVTLSPMVETGVIGRSCR